MWFILDFNWTTFNNGLILQYNCSVHVLNSWVFPIAFTTLNYVLVVTPITNTGGWPVVWASNSSVDRFVTAAHCDGTGNIYSQDSNIRNIYYNAIAIGY